ncbi:hypothetical protein FRACYDRAFT_248980 [Fragilariopsis cylindrus CCMP1102]|uniref:Amino acid transporter transmembrane domain-containing protein n=1 Tax=Fragilariopsis cylindrus CCMP1102 TaxID=635003 RepID=A0A1E7ESV0_9STRA|nr:hypothetical protein FRACYDRAFT_248980 [Fragilariopsis cylindrus CCMP1102]|eukprot:OEU09090.1 hypothetical protein FRACYDRAFT_248980 [Fragilariopsis cylindrus CCMP1102]
MMSGDDKKINDEKNVTSRTEAFKSSSSMIDAAIALDVVDDDDNNKGDGASKSDTQSETSSEQGQQHSKYIWLLAFYHSIVTSRTFVTLATSIFITCLSACCYYTAILLIDLREKGQGTYSEVADNIMGVGFSRFTVPIMILIGGQALATVDSLNGVQNISERWWLVIDAGIIMVLSLLPDLNRAWQVSVCGAFAAFLIVGYSIAGSIVALIDSASNNGTPIVYEPPLSVTEDPVYKFTLMASFGAIMFGYGFHSLLPDIQASLHDHDTKDSKSDMKKAVTVAFGSSYPAYITVALIGFAAFGYQIESEVLLSINNVLSKDAICIQNQAAFTLLRDITGLTMGF